LTGRVAGRANRGNAMIPGLYGIFPTADGWIAVVGVVGSARTTFYRVIGRPELSDQFPQPLYWDREKAELFAILDQVFPTRSTAAWCEVLGAAGLRYAPVRDHAQVAADPTVWENGYLAKVDTPSGEATVVATPVRFSDTPARADPTAPELGQHTEEVLLELGYSWADLDQFRAAGAI
jgi:crotonobetainyl-CoA:carnitine CoA-transferase CaiB-like acyl-CoA transferase